MKYILYIYLETLLSNRSCKARKCLVDFHIPRREPSSVNKGHLRILLKLKFWFSGSDIGLKISSFPESSQMVCLLIV